MLYSFDTNIIINGQKILYPIDFLPDLWIDIENLIESGDIRATEEVLTELKRLDDSCYKWATEHKDLFYPLDNEVQEAAKVILKDFPRLIDSRNSRSMADPWVVALAKAKELTVVTEERFSTSSDKKPHIPDVCKYYKIKCINFIDFIHEQGWVYKR